MKPKKFEGYITICRSSFCRTCWQQGRPKKGDMFVVFGTDHQEFKVKKSHVHGIAGFTPHLYTFKYPYERTEDGRVIVVKTCLMDTCGVLLGNLRQDGMRDIEFLYAQETALTEKSVEALISLWKGSGYELL